MMAVPTLTFGFSNNLIYEILACVCTILIIKKLWNSIYTSNKRPPGPWGLPLVGYLPFLRRDVYVQFNEMAQKYGQVFGITLGNKYFVVLNDFESAFETSRKEASLGRPEESFYNFNSSLHIANLNNDKWKEQRKFFSGFFRTIFRNDGNGANLHKILFEEIDHFQKTLEEKIKFDPTVNISKVLVDNTNNVMLQYLFGITLTSDDPIAKKMVAQQHGILTEGLPTNPSLCFPYLKWLYRNTFPSQLKMKKISKDVEYFISCKIEEHKTTLDPENPRDYVDMFLIRQKLEGPESFYTDSLLNSNCQAILTGGSDTTRTSLEWVFLLMAKFLDYQEKMYNEIIDVFGQDTKPSWEDRYKVPNVMATMMEAQRWQSIVPISAARRALDDFDVKGYTVSKGTIIVTNIWHIHNDETYWDKPAEFNPKRYLNPDGTFNQNERLLAFSIGKRDCPGKIQALMELYLFITATVQKFKILPPPGGVNLKENYEQVSGPIYPFVRFETRHNPSNSSI